jgi:hypothetical protein
MKWLLISVIAAITLTACGGGGSGDSGSPTVTNQSVGGIWQGTSSASGQQIEGLVDEAGEIHFIQADGVQYAGTVTVSGNSVTGTFDGFAPLGTTFADGSIHGTGTLTGTVQERSTFTANSTFTTDGGAVASGTLTLTFNAEYNQASSLGTLAGNYTDTATGTAVTIGADGTIFAQDASSGCVINGTVSILNASYNAYRMQATYANCLGANAVLNGVEVSGLGTLDTSASPQQVIAGVTGQAGSTKVALVYVLDRS